MVNSKVSEAFRKNSGNLGQLSLASRGKTSTLKILIAPAHFNLGEGGGSESATALKIIKVLATFADLTVVTGVQTGSLKLPANVNLITLYKDTVFNPSPLNRYKFLYDCARIVSRMPDALRTFAPDAVYHMFPFDRYHPSFLPLVKPGLHTPLIIGPVTVPHNLLKYPDEAFGFTNVSQSTTPGVRQTDFRIEKMFNPRGWLKVRGMALVAGARTIRPMTTVLMQKSLSRAAVLIAESEAAKKYYSQWLDLERIRVIYNYLEPEAFAFRMPKKEAKEIAVIGNLIKRKGVDRVIKILPALLKNHSKVNLRIIGDGPERDYLVTLARQLGVTGHVIFMGRIQMAKLRSALSGTAVVVSAAYEEAFANTLIEAMAFGVPVIGFHTASLSEIIQQQKTGFIIEQQDEAGFLHAIERLLVDFNLRQRIAQEAKRVVKDHFSKTAAISRFQAVFNGIYPYIITQ